jgi:hypothetical protein
MIDTNLKMPHVYLDMDGVQADLYNKLAEIHNVSSWNDILDKKNATLIIKMQGSKAVYNLFRNLEPLLGGQKIIKWLHDNNIPFTVLTAPFDIETDACIKGKKDWLDIYNPGSSKTCIFDKDKFKYAKTGGYPNVLIDDSDGYLDPFKNNGGIAIKYHETTVDKVIETLTKIYYNWLR